MRKNVLTNYGIADFGNDTSSKWRNIYEEV